MHAGNRSVLVMIDSRIASEARWMGCLRCCVTSGWRSRSGKRLTFPSAPAHFSDRALYVLGHDGAGRAVSSARARQIVAAVQAGAGFLSLDRRVEEWPAELQALAPKIAGRWRCQDLQVSAPGHYLSAGHAPGSAWLLQQAVACACTTDADWQAIVTANGQATMRCARQAADARCSSAAASGSIARMCLDMAAAMMACFGAQSSGRQPSRCRLAQCRHI